MWSSRFCDHEQRAVAATPLSRHRPRSQTASWEKVSRGGGACCGQVTVPPLVLHENDDAAVATSLAGIEVGIRFPPWLRVHHRRSRVRIQAATWRYAGGAGDRVTRRRTAVSPRPPPSSC